MPRKYKHTTIKKNTSRSRKTKKRCRLKSHTRKKQKGGIRTASTSKLSPPKSDFLRTKEFADVFSEWFSPQEKVTLGKVNQEWRNVNHKKINKMIKSGEIMVYDGNAIDVRQVGMTMDMRKKVKHIIFKPNISTIGNVAFNLCENLTTVNIPDSIKSIGWQAFKGCKKLETVEFPAGLETIGISAFEECKRLKSVDLSKTNIQCIERFTFAECLELVKVMLPNSLEKIYSYVFNMCKKLKSIDLSNTIIFHIDLRAFANCSILETVKFPTTLETIGQEAFSLTSIKHMDLSNTNITSLPDGAFANCRKLESLTLPSNVSVEGRHIFQNCFKLFPAHISPRDPNAVIEFLYKSQPERTELFEKYGRHKPYYTGVWDEDTSDEESDDESDDESDEESGNVEYGNFDFSNTNLGPY